MLFQKPYGVNVMLIKRRKMWVAPLMLIFGSSESEGENQNQNQNQNNNRNGAQCGESVLRYGAPCGIRVGQECKVRSGHQCQPHRFGPSCSARTGSDCVARVGNPCKPILPDEPLPPSR